MTVVYRHVHYTLARQLLGILYGRDKRVVTQLVLELVKRCPVLWVNDRCFRISKGHVRRALGADYSRFVALWSDWCTWLEARGIARVECRRHSWVVCMCCGSNI